MGGLWRFVKNYRMNSLFVRNFAVIFLSVLLSLVVLFIYTYNRSRSLVYNSVLDMNATVVTQTSDVMESVLDESTRMGAYLLNHELTGRFMFMERASAGMGSVIQLNTMARQFPMISRYIHSIYIYSEASGQLISSVNGLQSEFSDKSWMPAYQAGSGHEIPAVSRTGPKGYPYFMSVIMPYYFYGDEKKGAVVINVDMEKLDRVFQDNGRFSGQRIYLTDQDGIILYSKDKTLLSAHIDSVAGISGLIGQKDTTVFAEGKDGIRYIVTINSLMNRGWRLVSLLPMDVYDTHFKAFADTIRTLIIVLLLLGAAITLVTTVKTYAPVKNIIVDLERQGIHGGVRNGSLTEAEYIKALVLNASRDNQFMKLELEKRMLLLEQAQVGALQAQITPHFLANTLDAIRWGAVRLGDGENDVSRMIYQLSLMFQISLDMKNMLVRVADEVKYCELYLDIMSYRYKDLIQVEWAIDAGILGMTAMKLSLQPILENAIYHGIKPKKSAGKIIVSGYEQDGIVHIQIADDGIGLTMEEAQNINARMNRPAALLEKHVGMHNVNQRLKLVFGEEYGVSIRRGGDGGAVVELVFPVIPQRPD